VMDIQSGNFTPTGGTVHITGYGDPVYLDAGGGTFSFYNLDVNRTAADDTFTLQRTIDVNHDLTISKGEFNAGGFQINVGRNWTNNGSFVHANGNVIMDGGTAGSIGGTSATTFYNLKIAKSAMSSVVSAGHDFAVASTVGTYGLWLYSGTLDVGSRTITVGNFTNTSGSNGKLKMTNSSGRILDSGDFTFTGTGQEQVTAGEIDVAGQFYLQNDNWTPDGGKVKFTGSGSTLYWHSDADLAHFYNLEIGNGSGDACTFTGSGAWFDINGSVTINSGAYLHSNNHQVRIGRNWTNNGSFDYGTNAHAYFYFDGSSKCFAMRSVVSSENKTCLSVHRIRRAD